MDLTIQQRTILFLALTRLATVSMFTVPRIMTKLEANGTPMRLIAPIAFTVVEGYKNIFRLPIVIHVVNVTA